MSWIGSRREFLRNVSAFAGAGMAYSLTQGLSGNQLAEDAAKPMVLSPRGRVPLSFIIDDSTCLVNMGHFCTPQFHSCYPDRAEYNKPWKEWPREIPDAFVREFGEWCGENGVKGKYSVVPNPACVGWLDREIPGWSKAELQSSLKLVRDLLLPNWDIHPEMITHTRVIDLKTGRPIDEISPATMENSYPQEKKSADELAAYLAYALRILRNCELPCEGITTPGGFGNMVKSELALAVQHAVKDVYAAEVPHYFKYVVGGKESTAPKIEHLKKNGDGQVDLTVNIPAGTGDWFGGWQGDLKSEGDRYANAEATSGRMVELIERGEPALMLCHWPGMYCQGTKSGFIAFQNVVTAIHSRFRDQTLWMKLSEIARYYAAKEVTEIKQTDRGYSIQAPFSCPQFTLKLKSKSAMPPSLAASDKVESLKEIQNIRDLKAGTWLKENEQTVVCFDLPKGPSRLSL
jgi:hypothetical protein